MKKLSLVAAFVIGAVLFSGTIAWGVAAYPYAVGGTGTTTPSASTQAGRMLYIGPTGYQSVATTSASCSGTVSCSGFTVIGSSPITITGAGGSAGLSTSTPLSGGNLLVYSTTGAGYAYGIATSSTGTASTVLVLDSLAHTVIPYASTTAITATSIYDTGITAGQVVYSGGTNNLLRGAATSTPTGVDLTFSGTGATIGSLQINNPYKISTTSVPSLSIGNLAYFSGTSPTSIAGIATSSASCSGSVSCSSFTVVGSVAPTITSSALTTYDAFTHASVFGQITSATSTLLALTGSTYSLVASSSVMFGTAGADLRYDATNNRLGIASTTPAFRFSVGTAGSDFYISSTGEVVALDTTNVWNGRLSPTRSFVLFVATTTTWTASTTNSAYTPRLTMPFAGTVRQVRCAATSTTSFIGVNPFINTAPMTPSYFVASTTVGRILFTAANTFSAGDVIGANFGTTTTDANAKSVTCTFDVTETP